MKKRGISAVVATILIILIVVVGVGIVWKVVLPLFAELEFLSYSDVRLNIVFQGHTVYDPEQNFAFVQIERGKDEVNMTGIEIGFNFDGTTKTYQSPNVPQPRGKYTYKFNFTNDSDMGIPQDVAPDKVTVAPIFMINNKERLGKILDTEDMPVGRIRLSKEEWEKANNESATMIVVTTGGGGGEEPGKPVDPVEPVCVATGVEICGNDIDEDCVDGADDGCDLLGYFFAGDGSSGSPYIIENCLQLQNMSFDLTADYELKEDIDCSMTKNGANGLWTDGKGFDPVGISHLGLGFRGDFNGNGFIIKELFINRSDGDSVGLFRRVESSFLNNIRLVDAEIYGSSNVGGIAGVSYYSTISNSYNTGSVNGESNVGGIAGSFTYGSINYSYNTGSVNGSTYVGGIVGNSAAPISNSFNLGNISGTHSVGGIVGYSVGKISYSNNSGSITGSGNSVGGIAGHSTKVINGSYNLGFVSGSNYVGGIVGTSYLPIFNSHNMGGVRGSNYVGGIAGYSQGSTLTGLSNVGNVTSSSERAGGLVGYSHSSTITNSYNMGNVTGTNNIGGIAGDFTEGSLIRSSYNTGSVKGTYPVGGLVGYIHQSSDVDFSYNLGPVTGQFWVGGIAGYITSNGEVSWCYNTGLITGDESLGGTVGKLSFGDLTDNYYLDTSCVSPCINLGRLTDAQMRNGNSYAGSWNVKIDLGWWYIDDQVSYPYLLKNEQIPHPGT